MYVAQLYDNLLLKHNSPALSYSDMLRFSSPGMDKM